jgi:hypothetical protein
VVLEEELEELLLVSLPHLVVVLHGVGLVGGGLRRGPWAAAARASRVKERARAMVFMDPPG